MFICFFAQCLLLHRSITSSCVWLLLCSWRWWYLRPLEQGLGQRWCSVNTCQKTRSCPQPPYTVMKTKPGQACKQHSGSYRSPPRVTILTPPPPYKSLQGTGVTVPSPGRGPEPGVQLWVAASHPHLGQSVSLSLAWWSWRGPMVQLRPHSLGSGISGSTPRQGHRSLWGKKEVPRKAPGETARCGRSLGPEPLRPQCRLVWFPSSPPSCLLETAKSWTLCPSLFALPGGAARPSRPSGPRCLPPSRWTGLPPALHTGNISILPPHCTLQHKNLLQAQPERTKCSSIMQAHFSLPGGPKLQSAPGEEKATEA